MKKKMFLTFGTVVLMFGLGMNLQYAFADYGMETNSLHVMVLAQTSGGGDSTSQSDHGHQEKAKVECSIKIVDGSTTTIKTTSGEKYWCKGDNYVETCVNYDACEGFYDN